MKWAPARQFDQVLLDAPCSATGIFRRHPDVLHRVRPSDIADLARVQAGLLRRAAAWVKPGGMFIFCVCSLEPEEGEAQLASLGQADRKSTRSELQSLMRISYAVFCLKKKTYDRALASITIITSQILLVIQFDTLYSSIKNVTHALTS